MTLISELPNVEVGSCLQQSMIYEAYISAEYLTKQISTAAFRRRSELLPRGLDISVIFITKIKTRTRIIGRRFQRTRTRIIVIQKTKTK